MSDFDQFGAVGNGVADDTAAIQAAVNAAATGDRYARGTPGKVYRVSSVTLPTGNDITLELTGVTIQTTVATSYAFVQTAARRQVRILGGRFTGVGNGLNYTLAPSGSQSFDVHVVNTRFDLPAAKRALNLVGVREAVIRDCFFNSCTGIYLQQTVNTHVQGCQFRNCTYGIWADGQSTGNSFDAGLMVTGITAIGCGYALNLICWDYFSVVNSMIDYNDHSINVVNCSIGFVSDNYISNRNMASSSAPVVSVVSNPSLPQGGEAQHFKIRGNRLVCHATIAPTIGLYLDGVDKCSVQDNTIDFWSSYGVRAVATSAAPDGLHIVGNVVAGVNSPGPCISVVSTANRTYIGQNISNQPISATGPGIKLVDNNTA